MSNLLAGKSITGPETGRLIINGEQYVNFVGFNYLALQADPRLRHAAAQALELGQPWSQMGSSGYGGGDIALDDVAAAGASFFDTETSVYMATGYFCGPVAVEAVRGRYDAIFIDELAHFNLLDAAKISGRPYSTFRHRDAGSLEHLVKRTKGVRPLVLTDGVFATTGAIPPLRNYVQIATAAGGLVIVDESHAYGVVGIRGRGAAEHEGAEVGHAGTLSKAFCGQGALFPCSREVAIAVRRTPPLRGASSGSLISAMVCARALRIVSSEPERRVRLHELSQKLKGGLRQLGLEILDTPAPITSFTLSSRAEMLHLQQALFREGIHVLISNYIGAGPDGTVRCATFADHTDADIDRLVGSIKRIL